MTISIGETEHRSTNPKDLERSPLRGRRLWKNALPFFSTESLSVVGVPVLIHPATKSGHDKARAGAPAKPDLARMSKDSFSCPVEPSVQVVNDILFVIRPLLNREPSVDATLGAISLEKSSHLNKCRALAHIVRRA